MNKSYWVEFCLLTPAERRYLVESSITSDELTSRMLTLANRYVPTKLPKEKLFSEAGRFADSYRGEGWLFLRGLLISFYEHMKYLEELEKEGV